MIRSRRLLIRATMTLLLLATVSSCSFLANEFVLLGKAGPAAAPVAPPSGLHARP